MFSGTLYIELGFSDTAGDPIGRAKLSNCRDNGEGQVGPSFTDATKINVFAIGGVDSRRAVAEQIYDRSYKIFVSSDATQEERTAILREIE